MLFPGRVGLYGIIKQERNWVLQPGMKEIASPALMQPVLSLLEAVIPRNMAGAQGRLLARPARRGFLLVSFSSAMPLMLGGILVWWFKRGS